MPASFEEQVEVALKILKSAVNAAGGGLGAILKVNDFIADRKHIPAFNRTYDVFFDEHELPARMMLIAELPDPRYQSEIECILAERPD